MLRQTLPLLLVLAPIVARAQTQSPVLVQSGAQIQIPIPAGANNPRLQVLVAGTSVVLDDERANVQGGVASARFEADPGTYDIRVVANDKTRTPLGPARTFQVPGFKREAGRWLFNGSPVVYEGTNPASVFSTLPILRRDKKAKLPLSVPTTGNLKWDPATFGVSFTPKGPATTGGNPFVIDAGIAKTQFQQQRDASGAANSNGAFLFQAPFPGYNKEVLDSVAPLADALVVPGVDLNLLKVARRNVEEVPNFDLPLFARFETAPTASDTLRAFQAGASNIIVPEGASNPVLDVLAGQSARLSGAVTLEDVGLLVDDFDRFAPVLRRAGRVPLLARLPGEGNGENKDDDKRVESIMVAFDAASDEVLLDKIERAARAGATIYCEGVLPPALLPRWSEITKTEIAPLATPQRATVVFSDPWTWGTLNDQNFDVSRTVTVTVKPSISAQTRDVKGLARETVARPLARFNDDPNAIMLCPVNKGRIIWAPFNVAPVGRSRTVIGTVLTSDSILEPNNMLVGASSSASNSLLTAYYAAIAGLMQASLAEFTATKGDPYSVSVGLRAIPADPKDPRSSASSLIAFFNSSDEPVEINAEVRGDGDYALDLMTNKTVPVKVRDFGIRMTLQIPADGFRWIAVAQDEQSWNNLGKKAVRAQLR